VPGVGGLSPAKAVILSPFAASSMRLSWSATLDVTPMVATDQQAEQLIGTRRRSTCARLRAAQPLVLIWTLAALALPMQPNSKSERRGAANECDVDVANAHRARSRVAPTAIPAMSRCSACASRRRNTPCERVC